MSIRLKVVTPLGIFIDREIEYLSVKSSEGWLGILPGHANLVVPLEPAAIYFKTDFHVYDLAMTQGVMEVDREKNEINIVADAMFYKNQINYDVVTELLENAKKRLREVDSTEEKKHLLERIAEQEAKIKLLNLPGRSRLKS